MSPARRPEPAEGTRAPSVPGGRNIVLAALTGPHERFAVRVGNAMRYSPTVAPFATLPDDPTESDWNDLAEVVGDRSTILIRPQPALPPDWKQVAAWPVFQMVHAARPPAGLEPRPARPHRADARRGGPPEVVEGQVVDLGEDRIEDLGRADVADIRELVRLTRPGPFLADTIELGRYIGIRREGVLVAMAGERFRVPGATEVSAICTHPDHRGRGLADRLTKIVIDGIRARGELAFLHVITNNTPAVRLYEKLGFVVGMEYDAIAVRAPGGGPADTSELTVH